MKIVFITNAMTPHQRPLCDALNNMEGVDFSFIEMKNIDRASLPIGWRSNNIPQYVIPYTEFLQNKNRYSGEIHGADAVVLGGDYTKLIKHRLKAEKLTFVYSERIYRNFRDLLKMPYHYLKFRRRYGYSNMYLLCASAFSCSDYNRIGCFKNRAYKWGYFISKPNEDPVKIIEDKKHNKSIKLIWVSRLISWKHPEMPVLLAERLRKRGIGFVINMYGVGAELEKTKHLIKNIGLNDNIHLRGELPNDELMAEIRKHDIFLFTSDRNEGWGAVANEAMANACALVGSSAIGSIPFLVENGQNGLIYEDGNISSLENCVVELINNTAKRKSISLKAYETMSDMWSPQNAASRLVRLIRHLNNNDLFEVQSGPCSWAESLNNNWFKQLR